MPSLYVNLSTVLGYSILICPVSTETVLGGPHLVEPAQEKPERCSFPDCQAFQYHGQRLSLAAGNSISDFDGNDACLSPQLCQLLNCAEPAGQICRDSLSFSSAFYGNAAGHARSLPRGGLEGDDLSSHLTTYLK